MNDDDDIQEINKHGARVYGAKVPGSPHFMFPTQAKDWLKKKREDDAVKEGLKKSMSEPSHEHNDYLKQRAEDYKRPHGNDEV